MEHQINFYSLLIISVLAFAIPPLVSSIKTFRIPVVIAEIFVGIIFGKSGFNIIQNDLWIEFLYLFGFAYLMFLSGLEIDLSYFERFRKQGEKFYNPVVISISIFLGSVVLSFICAIALFYLGIISNPYFVALIFSTTSLGIVVPTLKEKNIMNEPIGQIILASAIIADFATMLILPIMVYFLSETRDLTILYTLFIFVLFGIVYHLWKKYVHFNFENPMLESSQLKIRAAFALVLIFVTVAEMIHVEMILGAFLAGVLFSLLFDKFKIEIVPKLDAIGYGFLIPIFFIMVGAKLDLRSAFSLQALIAVPIFVLIAYMVKLIPTLILKPVYSWKETLGAGFLLSSRLSLIIAVSLVALEMGAIKETTYSIFVLVAVITCMISPMAFLKVFPPLKKKKEHIVFVGNHDLITGTAKKIQSEETEFILVKTNEKIRSKFRSMNISYIYIDKLTEEKLLSIPDLNIVSFVAADEEDRKNVKACLIAKAINVQNIIAIISDPIISQDLENMGIRTITPMKAMHTLLYGNIKYPESFQVMYDFENNNNIEMKEIRLFGKSIVGTRLKNLKLPGDCLILLITRNGRRIVPDGNTKLENNDVIIVMGSKEYISETDTIFDY